MNILTYNKFINETNENLRYLTLDKELMKKLLDKIYEISSRQSDIDSHWKRWSKEDFLSDLPGKWKYSLVAMLGDDLVAFQINSLKTKNGFNFVHTNRILKNKKFKDIHIFKEMYGELFSLIKENGLTYWTCFTPFEKIKDLCVEQLGAKVSTNISDFMDRKILKVKKDGKLFFSDLSSLYFLTKKIA